MLTDFAEQASPRLNIRHGISAPATDLLRVAAIVACFAGLAIAVSHLADDSESALAPLAEDWHGNVASSGR